MGAEKWCISFCVKMKKTRRNIYLLLLKTSVWKEVRHFSVQCILTETTWLPTLIYLSALQTKLYHGSKHFGGGGLPIYDIVRMCLLNSPLFQGCQVYDKPPFSEKKVCDWLSFSSLIYEWSSFLTSLHVWKYSYLCSGTIIVLFIYKRGYIKIKEQYMNMFNQVYE